MASLSLERVSKKYNEHVAVDELDLQCADGELLVLLGAAGAGKTTILKIVAGIEQPTSGVVRVGRTTISTLPPQRRNVAMAFENYALYPHLTVKENMAFPLRARARARKLSEADIRTAVLETAKLLEMDALLDRFPGQLSGGQRQRVSLGRALVREPDVMLLDEPIAHLDAQLRATLRGQLKRLLKSRGVTTVYSTPDYTQALGLADRVGVLQSGRLVQLGTPFDVYENPLTIGVAELLGDPKINIVDAAIVATDRGPIAVAAFGHLDVRDWIGRFKLDAGDAISLGVRPADVSVVGDDTSRASSWTVELAEPLGATTMLTLSSAGVRLRCSVSGNVSYKVGDRLGVQIDPDRCLAFDRQSGRSLARTAAAAQA